MAFSEEIFLPQQFKKDKKCHVTLRLTLFLPIVFLVTLSRTLPLEQACQTGGPITCPIRPEVIFYKQKSFKTIIII